MCKINFSSSIFLLFLFVNVANIYCLFSSSWDESNNVIVLTNENFISKSKEYDVLLVMFFVKWCSHCRRLHPQYEQAATKLLENVDSPIHIAKLDCTVSRKAQCSKRYQLKGYPTLRIYRYGHFTGEQLNQHNRTTDEIVKTIKALKKNSEHQRQT